MASCKLGEDQLLLEKKLVGSAPLLAPCVLRPGTNLTRLASTYALLVPLLVQHKHIPVSAQSASGTMLCPISEYLASLQCAPAQTKPSYAATPRVQLGSVKGLICQQGSGAQVGSTG